MVTFKACPKCAGDIQHEGDRFGGYRQCLQCGYFEDEKVQTTVKPEEMGRLKPGRPRKPGNKRRAA